MCIRDRSQPELADDINFVDMLDDETELNAIEANIAVQPADAADDVAPDPASSSGSADPYAGVLPISDFWSTSGEYLFRHHVVPRTSLYTPTDADCPIPVKFLDGYRLTETSLDSESEKLIDDFRDGTDTFAKALSLPWVGKRRFTFLQPPSGKPGYKYELGRLTKIQETTRPPNVYPEVWRRLSDKKQKALIAEWVVNEPVRDACRAIRGITDTIAPADLESYFHILKAARRKLQKTAAPSMPVIPVPGGEVDDITDCLLYTSPSPRDATLSRMPSSA